MLCDDEVYFRSKKYTEQRIQPFSADKNGNIALNALTISEFTSTTTLSYYLAIADQQIDIIGTATSSVFLAKSNQYKFGDYVKLKFTIVADKTRENGFLVGFSNVNSNEKFAAGYIPTRDAIEFYYSDGTNITYQEILADVDAPNGNNEYTIEIEKSPDGTTYVFCNGQTYDVKSLISSFVFDFDCLFIHFYPRTATVTAVKDISFFTSNESKKSYDFNGFIRLSDYGKKAGRNLHIYEFGGVGIDWCFVRTPPNYDPNGIPHPIVICNHGNGWLMDGTEALANFTDHTQFGVDTTNDGAYTDTTNALYYKYSNSTIETLLNAGYVVCGAQNRGGNFYGNEINRRSCADFINHMINNYNVEKQVYIIAVSAGALTSLNVVHILPGIVKAMVLLYPLVNLENQYFNSTSAFATAIETAYDLASGVDSTTFKAATITHDPMTYGIVTINSTDYKIAPYPPIKFWSSPDDTVVDEDYNAMALYNLITNSRIGKVEIVHATGAHGDYTHFDPDAILAWFEKFK
jgi:hypothetical protein